MHLPYAAPSIVHWAAAVAKRVNGRILDSEGILRIADEDFGVIVAFNRRMEID